MAWIMRMWIVSLLLAMTADAEWSYRVRSPIVGKLGTIQLSKSERNGRYRIEGRAVTEGIARMLTGNREEHYLSEGRIDGGHYRTEIFRIDRKHHGKKERIDYRVDEEKQKVYKSRIRWKKGKKRVKKLQTLDYFAPGDLAALFFDRLPPERSSGAEELLAIGAEKIGGKVTIVVPEEREAAKERRKLGVGEEEKIVYILSPAKIGGKKNRKIVMAFDRDGILHKAYLIAIPIVGEIDVERVK
ncbi:hypothetical protein [Nitratifractor sp.]